MNTITTDIAVIGAGPSGLAAALRATEFGLHVSLFEKTSTYGGVYNGGMGPFGAGTHIQKEAGKVDGTPENAFNYLFDFTHGKIDARLASEYIRKTAFTVKWLEDYGVKYADPNQGPFGSPDDKEYFCHVIADNPEFKEEDGSNKWMYIPSLLYKRAVSTGKVDFYFNTPVTKLIRTDGRLTGLIAQQADGEVTVEAKAVIIATGGFMGNPELIKKYTSYENNVDIFFSRQRPNICGDGMQMAWDIGAARGEMMVDVYKGMPIHCGPAGTKEGWEILADPNLLVNVRGERFMNEAYPDRYYMANAIHRQPKGTAFMITSTNIVEKYKSGELKLDTPPGMPAPEVDLDVIAAEAAKMDYPYIYAADSIEELCEKTGIRLDGLKATLAEYNSQCEAGQDPIFYKKTNLYPLNGPKYYAAQFYVDSFGCLGGLKINYKLEVVDEALDAIPGLYGVGSEANALYGGTYPGKLSGNTSGFAYNSGIMAAENAAAYLKTL
jgi:fumarate reductase flavoprotein subunit